MAEYSSSHREDVRGELVVQSGLCVQTLPVAIYEVRRILREHLKEEKKLRFEAAQSSSTLQC